MSRGPDGNFPLISQKYFLSWVLVNHKELPCPCQKRKKINKRKGKKEMKRKKKKKKINTAKVLANKRKKCVLSSREAYSRFVWQIKE
jgi:hypothetical protein